MAGGGIYLGIRWGLPSGETNALYFSGPAAIARRVEALKAPVRYCPRGGCPPHVELGEFARGDDAVLFGCTISDVSEPGHADVLVGWVDIESAPAGGPFARHLILSR